jgi:hypothetical protein
MTYPVVTRRVALLGSISLAEGAVNYESGSSRGLDNRVPIAKRYPEPIYVPEICTRSGPDAEHFALWLFPSWFEIEVAQRMEGKRYMSTEIKMAN